MKMDVFFDEFSCRSIRRCARIFLESIHDRVVASRTLEYRETGIHKRGGDAGDNL